MNQDIRIVGAFAVVAALVLGWLAAVNHDKTSLEPLKPQEAVATFGLRK